MKANFTFIALLFTAYAQSQCSIPPGAIKIETGPGAVIDFANIVKINSGQVYYVPSGTSVTISHTSSNLTVDPSGKILVMPNATLIVQLGVRDLTLQGEVQVCQRGYLQINGCHDFDFNVSTSKIVLDNDGAMAFCNLSHNLNFNQGNIYMNDFTSLSFINYNTLTVNQTNLIIYTGGGTVNTGAGNPLFFTGGSDYVGFAYNNTINNPLTTSNHIDYLNDNFQSGNNNGAAYYCGPRAKLNNLACRSMFPGLGSLCSSAKLYQDSLKFVLPIDYIYFKLSSSHHDVLVQWGTAQEISCRYFEVERSVDGRNWQTIATVNSTGEIGTIRHYSYMDRNVPLVNAYYRIREVDLDGTRSYTDVRMVSLEKVKSEIKILNHANNEILINFSNQAVGSFTAVISNTLGTCISTKTITNPFGMVSISAGKISTGSYLVTVFDENGIMVAKQILFLRQ